MKQNEWISIGLRRMRRPRLRPAAPGGGSSLNYNVPMLCTTMANASSQMGDNDVIYYIWRVGEKRHEDVCR